MSRVGMARSGTREVRVNDGGGNRRLRTLDQKYEKADIALLKAVHGTGWSRSIDEKETFVTTQLQANRWTYIGSGVVHPKFQEMLERLGADAREAHPECSGHVFIGSFRE